jgi:hypothetical protein
MMRIDFRGNACLFYCAAVIVIAYFLVVSVPLAKAVNVFDDKRNCICGRFSDSSQVVSH